MEPPPTGKPSARGLTRVLDATRYSLAGLRAAWRFESAFRWDVVGCGLLFIASFFVARGPVEWVILVAPLFVSLIVELLNSALEATVDRVGVERHPLSGRAKDQASAAVMLSLVLIAVCWGAVIWSQINA